METDNQNNYPGEKLQNKYLRGTLNLFTFPEELIRWWVKLSKVKLTYIVNGTMASHSSVIYLIKLALFSSPFFLSDGKVRSLGRKQSVPSNLMAFLVKHSANGLFIVPWKEIIIVLVGPCASWVHENKTPIEVNEVNDRTLKLARINRHEYAKISRYSLVIFVTYYG